MSKAHTRKSSMVAHPSKVILRFPDFVAPVPYPLRVHRLTKSVSRESEEWLLSMAEFSPKQRSKFLSLNAGLLSGMCYIDCGYEEARVCADFMNFLFTLDDWSDEFDTTGTRGLAECVMNTLYHPSTYLSNAKASKLTKSFWDRMIKTAGPRCQQRLMSTLDTYFQAIMQQASDRGHKNIPDLDEYITLRRDTSGCKTGFAFIEYAGGIDLPDEVADHPIISALADTTNDLVSWANDVLSYNAEQARGDTHNLVCVLMQAYGVDRQGAINLAGELWKQTLDYFMATKETVPSWGPEIDRQVAIYIKGFEDWIIANAEWSFETERYFGKDGHLVRKTRQVELLPLRRKATFVHLSDDSLMLITIQFVLFDLAVEIMASRGPRWLPKLFALILWRSGGYITIHEDAGENTVSFAVMPRALV
ncbi:Alpha-muurolene synthase [Grifola frondosa]|uniref:Terpene synthase n=1 Tax=Grifola frondosa TaxID=5627 RepID=A0A1C7M7N1_GRIFR|nr:Alpha-muurolene synthase [Grifola frondosa]